MNEKLIEAKSTSASKTFMEKAERKREIQYYCSEMLSTATLIWLCLECTKIMILSTTFICMTTNESLYWIKHFNFGLAAVNVCPVLVPSELLLSTHLPTSEGWTAELTVGLWPVALMTGFKPSE